MLLIQKKKNLEIFNCTMVKVKFGRLSRFFLGKIIHCFCTFKFSTKVLDSNLILDSNLVLTSQLS